MADKDGELYDLMSDGWLTTESLDGAYEAILTNPDVVLRALGGTAKGALQNVDGYDEWWFPND